MAPDLIASWRAIFLSQKKLAEGALSQLSDDQLHQRLAPNLNPAAIIIQHLAGNMLSRWTDWLTTDGEKPTRDREAEFEDRRLTRAELMQLWERGWSAVFAALDALTPDDLSRTITIRGQPHSIPDAVNRQISHYGYHTGQLHFLARGLAGDQNWNWQTVAPGKTQDFNREMARQYPEFRAPGR
jgi:hypothetical protein